MEIAEKIASIARGHRSVILVHPESRASLSKLSRIFDFPISREKDSITSSKKNIAPV